MSPSPSFYIVFPEEALELKHEATKAEGLLDSPDAPLEQDYPSYKRVESNNWRPNSNIRLPTGRVGDEKDCWLLAPHRLMDWTTPGGVTHFRCTPSAIWWTTPGTPKSLTHAG